ncbi:hypothetical protein FACI_IFERC00001G0592 [Ferroplasma acidarmanus Fer1]|uniref:Uncharacterized protein n=2 Tax=Ferroplasma TaxID=74968 RepID=S0AP74_FERAC|nr:hypothetical protein FACI_IFERC00001G0592 [Ferroplasma acidarmanus Fer1]
MEHNGVDMHDRHLVYIKLPKITDNMTTGFIINDARKLIQCNKEETEFIYNRPNMCTVKPKECFHRSLKILENLI